MTKIHEENVVQNQNLGWRVAGILSIEMIIQTMYILAIH